MTPLHPSQIYARTAFSEPDVPLPRVVGFWQLRPETKLRYGMSFLGLSLAAFFFGFVLFAVTVMRDHAVVVGEADGIIVLTGGDFRILEGARLLREGRARHLLISGVNPKTSRDDLLKLTGLNTQLFDCCVELGYAAQDTVGNAEEARTWVMGRKMSRLIVVTSSYHMLRSMAELALRLPGVELVPDPVVPRAFRNRAWWLHFGVSRILMSEYLKYLPVAARLETMKHVAPFVAPTTRADGFMAVKSQ
jgi:uncharacterized SAM-binding protein YcdF (DUF218 family)